MPLQERVGLEQQGTGLWGSVNVSAADFALAGRIGYPFGIRVLSQRSCHHRRKFVKRRTDRGFDLFRAFSCIA
jgi:hypothetical protein